MAPPAGGEAAPPEPMETTAGVDTTPDALDRWFRRVLVAALAALLVSAAAGWLGVSTDTVAAEAGGLRLEVEHATTSRAGLATPFDIAVSTLDGGPLPETLDVVVDASYLAMFDENGLDPQPGDAWSHDDLVVWTYRPPAGEDSLTISFDARLEPAVQRGRDGRVAVAAGGEEVVAVTFATAVMP